MCDQGCKKKGGAKRNRGSCDKTSTLKSPVAKIPWLPQPSEKIEFEKSDFYKCMTGSSSVNIAKQKRELYRVLNETFPFYLPKRYHEMECKELHLKCPNGQYWANAAHFMYATHAHDHYFYRVVRSELNEPFTNLTKVNTQPVFNMEFKHTILKNGSAECESAAEYLLEPWVLLQLLTQPIIMYQWAIALLAESTRLTSQITDIVEDTSPRDVQQSVQSLHRMANNTKELANELIQLFYACIASHKINPFVHTRSALKKLHLMLKLYLPSISFIVSDECKSIIKTLRRMYFKQAQSTSSTENAYSPLLHESPKVFLFHSQYWNDCRVTYFYKTLAEVRLCNEFIATILPILPEDREEQPLTNEEYYEKLKINAKELKNLTKERKAQINEFCKVYPNYRKINQAIALVKNSTTTGLPDSDSGVIYNLICLNNDLEASKLGTIQIDAGAQENDGPELTLESIKESLGKAMEPCKESYIDHVQNIIKSKCFSSNWEEMPDDQGMEAEKIADHLEERIKVLVFKLTLEHNIGLEKTGPYTYYPEVLFIQYLLPCFVASFLDLVKDENASHAQKQKYLIFVHELIKCYEDILFSQDLLDKFKFSFTVCVRNHSLWIQMQIFRDDVHKFFKSILGDTEIFKQIETFVHFLSTHNEKMVCLGTPTYGWPTKQWHMHMFMFFCRIRSAAEEVGWKGDCYAFCHLRELSTTVCAANKNLRDVVIVHELIKFVSNLKYQNVLDKGKTERKRLTGLKLAVTKITILQLQAISISLLVKNLDMKKYNKRNFEDWQGPVFPFDPIYAYWHLIRGDKWLAKLALLEKVVTEEREDPTLVTLEFAKSNKCYDFVLPRVTREGKVKMKRPGEITFVPIKHCRWCGLAKVEVFRLCPECKENEDYPDVNFFCSENCETEALEKQHMEEHARYLMKKCGI